ncbi:MAG: phosphatase PAP2 family protein [Candidatus Lokiarchaeota archaeon]|nr:phosphatase PAP2 family protein [Candidatus Lokiarchaeota archaeon]
MEEPQILDEQATNELQVRRSKPGTKSPGGRKRKVSGVLVTYIIVLAVFVVGVIVCSIDGGSLDLQITKFFSDLGHKKPLNPDGSPNFWYQLGTFFDPDLTEEEFWTQGLMGQMISYVVIIIAILAIFVPMIASGIEKSKAKKENRKPVEGGSMRYYKYGWLIGFVGILVPLGINLAFKYIWGRPRPDDDFTNFIPWFIPAGIDAGESFMSGHTQQATLVTGLALAFLGSRKRGLSIVFGIGSVILVVLTGMARMLTNDHYFSDVLWGGFTVYSIMLIVYYAIIDIPGQERIHRYKRTYTPFNEGYKLVLDGKAKLKESPDEGLKLVSAGLEKFAVAKAAAEDINKHHREFESFIGRVDDLASRLGTLINEYQSVGGKKENLDAYLLKWSYVC